MKIVASGRDILTISLIEVSTSVMLGKTSKTPLITTFVAIESASPVEDDLPWTI